MTQTRSFAENFRRDWFAQPRADILAGIVVALALIPEAIGFALIAGVDPSVGLYASVAIAMVIAFTGGRPGMISAATAAVAVVVIPLVRDYGVDYLFAATILMGIFQGIAAVLRLDLLMQFVSRSVITGFVNALAILIFMAQIPQLMPGNEGVGPWTWAMVAVGLGIIYGFPRITKSVPSPLVAIVLLTAAAIYWGLPVNNVAGEGTLPDGLPTFALPDVPLTWETLQIIAPYSLTMAAVGLLESLLTAQIVDDMTHTESDKRRESAGQGIANVVAACFGGMGGCAMIGQSVINVTSGGRGRLSTFTAGAFLLFLLTVLGSWVGQVPMPALVAVMIMVSIGTFSWNSIPNLRRHPPTSSIVMIATVVTVVWTHDLALGVLVGVLLSGIFFAQKVKNMFTVERVRRPHSAVYHVRGEIFFASVDRFVELLGPESQFEDAAHHVVIDVSQAHFWDISAIGALEKVIERMRRNGRHTRVVGLNTASADLFDRFALEDRTGVELGLSPTG
ncbi:sodium-independent anion transporter [Erythrobacter sp. KY5]|uniref:SulP family inorganic anion transporter n=1 Tax=Erythrobacter sp. KY5 TaxID=2011159 RepID=UPI000DBEF311|nr:SulP family inorganic anion transporter [Erythrobacter sp. KY5]AWW75177.1 sodium-independent anion transporter [Erythrobacter sp. KY5]